MTCASFSSNDKEGIIEIGQFSTLKAQQEELEAEEEVVKNEKQIESSMNQGESLKLSLCELLVNVQIDLL